MFSRNLDLKIDSHKTIRNFIEPMQFVRQYVPIYSLQSLSPILLKNDFNHKREKEKEKKNTVHSKLK